MGSGKAYVSAHEAEIASWGDGPFTDEDFSQVRRGSDARASRLSSGEVLALPASVFMGAHTKGAEPSWRRCWKRGARRLRGRGEHLPESA